jgi:hypothetical protein
MKKTVPGHNGFSQIRREPQYVVHRPDAAGAPDARALHHVIRLQRCSQSPDAWPIHDGSRRDHKQDGLTKARLAMSSPRPTAVQVCHALQVRRRPATYRGMIRNDRCRIQDPLPDGVVHLH